MFMIDTASPRWRRLAVTSLALPLSFALSGTASAASPQSAADLTIAVSCFGIDVTSDKDISNVKVTFADGTTEELSLSGLVFSKKFNSEIASATAKSGTTQVGGTATGCSTTPAGDEDAPVDAAPVDAAPVDAAPVKDRELPDTTNGTATITVTVDCRTVSVESDKDISNVKVTFVDGTEQEINGLSGYTFERTFAKDIDFATSKSATTEVLAEAEACAAVAPGAAPVVPVVVVEDTPVVVVEDTPVVVVEDTPAVCPTEQVMGPVMEGCETSATPIAGQPVQQPAAGGDVDAPAPVQESPAAVDTPAVEETPVVAEETPDQSTIGTPVAGQPAPQAAVGAGGVTAVPAAGTPAQAPTAVVANGAVAPAAVASAAVTPAAVTPAAVSTVSAPASLPFTGTDTDALLQLGSVLVMAGGGAMLVGRRQRTAKHVRTAKHARLA